MSQLQEERSIKSKATQKILGSWKGKENNVYEKSS